MVEPSTKPEKRYTLERREGDTWKVSWDDGFAVYHEGTILRLLDNGDWMMVPVTHCAECSGNIYGLDYLCERCRGW